ncbi:uncharacterized protein BJ171DRAFT_489867 [Polychytrium aggregatum]|uniref:uncharacterized protein n=1 Tax=Polychytrium aggregatum TaxID=110093 RepID=UPI0022FDDDC7|nr:uncharacterized protein BJ171DRAFT_489867 [Polychytrium aggregatum]KAI9208750.1 hypothetical protein BJ171DRAFT_489867 [Polychytrium aggregatum]
MARTQSEGPRLVQFTIFSPALGPTEETVDRQICFSYPTLDASDSVLREVGLAQAIINFTANFGSSRPGEIIKTRRHVSVVTEPEDGWWMLMKIARGFTTETRKDGTTSTKYASNLPDEALKSLVGRAYRSFQILHRGFRHFIESRSLSAFKETLEDFYTRYLDRINVSGLDLLTTFNGISLIDPQRESSLAILAFIRSLQTTFPELRQPLLLWDHHVVYSGFKDLGSLHQIYDYLTDPETGKINDNIINQVKQKGEAAIGTRPASLKSPAISETSSGSDGRISFSAKWRTSTRFCGFLVGPIFSGDALENDSIPKRVYLGDNGIEHYLIVYQVGSATIAFALPKASIGNPQTVFTRSFWVNLKIFLDDRLAEVAEQAARREAESEAIEQTYQHFYYDSTTRRYKTTFVGTRGASGAPEIIDCLDEINDELTRPELGLKEIYLKTKNDAWLVGQKSGGRTLLAVVPKTDMNLNQLEQESKRLSDALARRTYRLV